MLRPKRTEASKEEEEDEEDDEEDDEEEEAAATAVEDWIRLEWINQINTHLIKIWQKTNERLEAYGRTGRYDFRCCFRPVVT